jgi:phosphatidylglycerophosphatase C
VTEPSAPTAEAAGTPSATTTVAAFDFDGTLTDGGSVYPFLVALRGTVTVARVTLRQSPHLLHAALVGGTTADAAKEVFFTRLLGGLDAAEVDRVSAAFVRRHLARKLRPAAARRLEWHRAQGHHVVIVSASPECYVGVAAEVLGVGGGVATRLAVTADGRLTGGYEGKNCRGEEKLNRLTAHLEAHGLLRPDGSRPELWAYGNSRGDLRLLQAADHGVDAGKLGWWGRLRRFPRLSSVDAAPARPTG